MPKIDEATNPPNQRMHEWAKRRAVESLSRSTRVSTYTYACWHVVTSAHGGEFRALFWITLGAIKRWAETRRAALEIWYERTFLGKTDEDFDRECEETARWLQSLCRPAAAGKPSDAKSDAPSPHSP
ncbi:MAG TPA: hypothetical protein VK421_06230 [Pyrinomonadaceae bacterium]|nr:hypothetical protein [Pyrinomonadaceae bacterium]